MSKNETFKIEKFDILIFSVVIIIFGLCLLAFYPALMTSDSPDQINQALTGNYNDAHPMFHSFLIGSFVKTFGSVSSIAIMQIIVFAFIWTSACKITRDVKQTYIVKLLQVLFTLIICFLPINFMYSITIWKDILYTYSIFGLILFIYIGIKRQYNYTYLEFFLLSISLVLTMKTRHNGIIITGFMLILLLLLNLIKNKKWIKTLTFSLIFTILLILSYIPQWYYKVPADTSGTGSFTGAATYAMGSLLNQNIPLEQSEYEILNNILPVSDWKSLYTDYSGVLIHFSSKYNKVYLSEHEEEFMKIFIKYAKQNKLVIAKHFIKLDSIMWSITEREPLNTIVLNNSAIKDFTNGAYETTPKSTALNVFFNKLINKVSNNRFLYTATFRPALPMYLSIAIVIYLAIKKKKADYVLIVFPMLLNIAPYLILITSQDLRYFYPSFITFYFSVLLLIENRLNCSYKVVKPIVSNFVNKKDPKSLVIVPAYNEGKNIEKVIDELKMDIPNSDILVINDCSKDNTKQIVESNNVKCITTVFNLNYAYAVQTGIKFAYKNNYDYCIQFDGDGQHIAKEANKLLDKIKETNCDIVIGSRYLEDDKYKAPFFRKLGTVIFSKLIKMSCNKVITDPLSGFQVLNRNVIEKYSKMGEYPEFPDANLIIEMLLEGYDIQEVSVEMRKREFGESMHGGILKPIKYMVITLYTIILLVLNSIIGRRK